MRPSICVFLLCAAALRAQDVPGSAREGGALAAAP